MKKSTIHFLLARFMETEYDIKTLAAISRRNFDNICENMFERFEDDELTEADIKEAWKSWFDFAAYGGLLVSPAFDVAGEEDWMHPHLDVIDKLLEVAYAAIDRL